jgi:hypothetical protein
MKIAGAVLLVVGIALAIFELPTALSPGDGDVEHGWAVAGAMLAAILVALGAVLVVVSRWWRRRLTKAG